MTDSKEVAAYSLVQDAQVKKLHLPRTLMGGTRAMRAAGEKYLPKEEAETSVQYENRLNRSTLFNAFSKTVLDMTGRVFLKPIVIGDDADPRLKEYAENVDLTGRHLNVFARDLFADAMVAGASFVLVDMPPAKPGATRADEQESGHRPYMIHVRAEDILGWRTRLGPDGIELAQVRIMEREEEPDGPWGTKIVEQVRVLEPGRWQIWRASENSKKEQEWVLWREGTTSVNRVTLVPLLLKRTSFMTSDVTLEDLADLNVAHWQSGSDQRNILHVARVPILFGSGFGAESDVIAVGASVMSRAADPAADLKYVEHSGSAINAGRQDLIDLENRMAAVGLMLLVDQPGQNQSATGENRDATKEASPLSVMAQALQDALEVAMGYMALYMGAEEAAGGSLVVNKDFAVTLNGAQDLTILTQMRNTGNLSRETLWDEAKRRGVLKDDFDPALEAGRIAEDQAEAVALAGEMAEVTAPPEPEPEDPPPAE